MAYILLFNVKFFNLQNRTINNQKYTTMKIDAMVVLTEYDSITQAEMAKSLLDEMGIWSMINNEYMSTIYPTGIMPAQIIVMREDQVRAQRALESIVIGEQDGEIA